MMNLSIIFPKTWTKIIRGASSWKQDYSGEDACHRYRVTYPNGYGVSITGYPHPSGQAPLWRVVLTRNDELYVSDNELLVKYPRSQGEICEICDFVNSL